MSTHIYNEMKFKDFQVLGTIGKGGYGDVQLCILCKSKKNFEDLQINQLVAMKVVLKKCYSSVKTEVDVNSFLQQTYQ